MKILSVLALLGTVSQASTAWAIDFWAGLAPGASLLPSESGGESKYGMNAQIDVGVRPIQWVGSGVTAGWSRYSAQLLGTTLDVDTKPVLLEGYFFPIGGLHIGPRVGVTFMTIGLSSSIGSLTIKETEDERYFSVGGRIGYDYKFLPNLSLGADLSHIAMIDDNSTQHQISLGAMVKFWL